MKNTTTKLFLLLSFLFSSCSQRANQSLKGEKYYYPSQDGNIYLHESSFYSFNGNIMVCWEALNNGGYYLLLRKYERHDNIIWAESGATGYWDRKYEYGDSIDDIIKDKEARDSTTFSLFGEIYNGVFTIFENPSYLEVKRYMTVKTWKQHGKQIYVSKAEEQTI